jgi:hypothetical protein
MVFRPRELNTGGASLALADTDAIPALADQIRAKVGHAPTLPAGRDGADNAGLNAVPLGGPEPGRRQQPVSPPPGASLAAAPADERGQ